MNVASLAAGPQMMQRHAMALLVEDHVLSPVERMKKRSRQPQQRLQELPAVSAPPSMAQMLRPRGEARSQSRTSVISAGHAGDVALDRPIQ
jgi:hypothetical protein